MKLFVIYDLSFFQKLTTRNELVIHHGLYGITACMYMLLIYIYSCYM